MTEQRGVTERGAFRLSAFFELHAQLGTGIKCPQAGGGGSRPRVTELITHDGAVWTCQG